MHVKIWNISYWNVQNWKMKKSYIIKLQRPREENTLKKIGELVFHNDEINENKIYNLWMK